MSYFLRLRYFVLSFLVCCFIVVESIISVTPLQATTPPQSLQQAQHLIQQGQIELNQGRAQKAWDVWREATELYRQLEDEEGAMGGSVNQSLALQALGKYYISCQVLTEALDLDPMCDMSFDEQVLPRFSPSWLHGIGLRALGNSFRNLGKLALSQEALQQSINILEILDNSRELSQAFLALGNTQSAIYQQQRKLYERTGSLSLPYRDAAVAAAQEALASYSQVGQASLVMGKQTREDEDNIANLLSQVNRLSLLLELKNLERLEREEYSGSEFTIREISELELALEVNRLLQQFLASSRQNSRAVILQAQLHFVHYLLRYPPASFDNWGGVEQLLDKILKQARHVENQRIQAYSLGYLGRVYERNQQLDLALQAFSTAKELATVIDAPDIAFWWEAELGKLYRLQGDREQAIAAYEAASADINKVRQQLSTLNSDFFVSFVQDIKPIYLGLIGLYLEQPNQENIEKTLGVYEKLQLAELQNLVQCDVEDTITLEKSVKDLENAPTVFYTIFLEDEVKVIIHAPQQPLSVYGVNRQQLTQAIEQLRGGLDSLTQPGGLWVDPQTSLNPYAQKIYQLLLLPAKQRRYLEPGETLVFALDSLLQNIPIALLHDGKQYLVEQYNFAIAPGARLKTPQVLPPSQVDVLFGGLSAASPSFAEVEDFFSPLDNVITEMKYLNELNVTHKALLNESFTTEEFQETLQNSDLPILHLATHGKFSSDPQQTYLLAYDYPIQGQQLGSLIRHKAQTTTDSLELLVLSACQTAQADQRSILGMAGIALQAGARSTLASLWNISDQVTPVLIQEFYQGLKAGKTKAEALGDAQRKLIQDPNYNHPYYWGAFVLAGSWL